jgi:hypothetical protein
MDSTFNKNFFNEFHVSYSAQRKFVDNLFNEIGNQNENTIVFLLKSLVKYIDVLGFPFALLLNNNKYMAILIDLYYENENFKNLIYEIITKSINKFEFEDNRFINSIEEIYQFANLFFPNFQPSIKRRDPSDCEMIFNEFQTLLNDCIDIKNFIENEKTNIEEENLKQILLRISKMTNVKLKLINKNNGIYIYEFFQELANSLEEYENFFCGKIKSSETPGEEFLSFKNIIVKTDPKLRTSFYYNEVINDDEGLQIEYKNYNLPFSSNIVENLKKQFCGFLNADGGRLYVGITDDKIVKGIRLTAKQRDLLRNDLANYTIDFYPSCRTSKFEVVYVPLKNKMTETYMNNLWVVKIIVKQGDVDKLYSTVDKGFSSYIRMPGQCVFLSASEIVEEILKRKTSPRVKIDEKEFQDPQVEVPLINEENTNSNTSNTNNKNYKNNKNNNHPKSLENLNKKIPKVRVELNPENKQISNDSACPLNYKIKINKETAIQNEKQPNIKDNKICDDFPNKIIQPNKVFSLNIQGIPTSVKEDEVVNLLIFTNPCSYKVFTDHNSFCKGWAYFNYDSESELLQAMTNIKDLMINGAKLQVKIKHS